MIWDFIRDFIVEHITGGHSSTGNFGCRIGSVWNSTDGLWDITTADVGVKLSGFYDVTDGSTIEAISLGDWLATTLTAICMCLIVAFAIWLVIWVFKAVAHAFLLRR